MNEPRAVDVTANGVALRLWEWDGRAPTALLLHGLANYGRYWDLVAREIDGRLRLIAPDARGHGDSAKPADGYASANYVADALGLLDALEIERALLVGHSMGGRHAATIAATNPDRVLGLVLVDTSAEPLPEGRERAVHLTAGRPERFADRAEALAYLRSTSPGYTDEVYENRVRWAFAPLPDLALAWRSSRAALLRTLEDRTPSDDLFTILARIEAPTIVLRGTRSNVLSVEVARRMVDVLRDGELIEVDAGHNVALERPAETASAILSMAS